MIIIDDAEVTREEQILARRGSGRRHADRSVRHARQPLGPPRAAAGGRARPPRRAQRGRCRVVRPAGHALGGRGRGARPADRAVPGRGRWRHGGVGRPAVAVQPDAAGAARYPGRPDDFRRAAAPGGRGRCATATACRSGSARTASRSSWTSRKRRWRAWARTACASVRPVPASRSSCARWCWGCWPRTRRTALNMVLVDFKGGATFLGLEKLPHVAAVITNLADDAHAGRPDEGRARRRDEPAPGSCCENAGNFKNVWDYEKARENGADLDPLPALFIVIDEFSELLAAKPDFIDLFVAIGRLGRSLQMHMLLASQRLEEGKLRGLDSHLSYRIGLKTFSAAESRAAIGVPDAFELPPVPGSGYLKYDTSTLVRFKAAYVSGPYRPAGHQGRRGRCDGGACRQATAAVRADFVRVAAASRSRSSSRSNEAAAGIRGGRRAERDGRDRRPDGRPGATRARGVAAAVGRSRQLARHDAAEPQPPPTIAACPPVGSSATAGCRCRSASSTGRSSSGGICCGRTSPAAPGTASSSVARSPASRPCCAR